MTPELTDEELNGYGRVAAISDGFREEIIKAINLHHEKARANGCTLEELGNALLSALVKVIADHIVSNVPDSAHWAQAQSYVDTALKLYFRDALDPRNAEGNG